MSSNLATEQPTKTRFYWLIELRPAFEGHPPYPATYYAGYELSAGNMAWTTNPNLAPKWMSKDAAECVSKQLCHTLSGIWQAVEHGSEEPDVCGPDMQVMDAGIAVAYIDNHEGSLLWNKEGRPSAITLERIQIGHLTPLYKDRP